MYGEEKKRKQGFTYKQIGLYGTDVKVSICSESTLTDQCVAFGAFLRACGYHFEGEVDIVQDDVDSSSSAIELDEDIQNIITRHEKSKKKSKKGKK